jgi:glycerophosphoryl diester phosphodiesterase
MMTTWRASQWARWLGWTAVFGLLAASLPVHAHQPHDDQRDDDPPIVIGHRGASGYAPEHTLVAYFMAIEQGADYIEPDLVMTKDGVLVARHENEISGTTDVASRPEFADRRTTKTIDGTEVTGWFTEDFTLAELKTLRAKERLPELRPANARFDGMFAVPTLEEVLALVQGVNNQRRQTASDEERRHLTPIGVYPETKHPTYFAGIGLPMEEALVTLLERYGYHGKGAPVFIQSFEVANLKQLAVLTDLPLVQLLNESGQPYDFVVAGDPRTYADLAQRAGLAEVATYASGIGVPKSLLIPLTPDGALGTLTTLVDDAHANGLIVHSFTFRAENYFLSTDFQSRTDPAAVGDLSAEVQRFLALGIDGFFTDHADIGVRARDAFMSGH